jgi:bacterioferritin-associated ferredoxin
VYVCICNALKESQVRLVAGTLQSAHDLHPALGCRVRCGRCLPTIAGFVGQAKLDRSPIETAAFPQAAE